MRKNIITLILVMLFLSCGILKSQKKEAECNDITVLKELTIEEYRDISEYVKRKIKQDNSKNIEIYTLFCPPTELYFSKNCDFPIKYDAVRYHIGMLNELKESKLILETHSDNIGYKKNPNRNLVRAENVKSIFVYYGIVPERIEIIDIKDEHPMDTNKTSAGRDHNRYVRMIVQF